MHRIQFQEFEREYEYRPRIDPEILRQAFFAILSSTYNWKKFRGSGLIPATDLEQTIEIIQGVVPREDFEPVFLKVPTEKLPLKEFRQFRRKQAAQQKRTMDLIQSFPVEGIDPKRTLAKQKFSDISMSEGKNAEEIFFQLLKGQQKGE